jgi:RimJ/RimL family protein N-acetyltransferase
MKFDPISFTDKLGRSVVLRSAERSDAADMIAYLKTIAEETPYLMRESDEIHLTIEQQEAFLRSKTDAARELMLVATVDGKHVGNCSLMEIAPYKRYSHRCNIAIAIYQAYCGSGIGKRMMQTVLDIAKGLGYEQAELEVVSDNKVAIALYEKLGFVSYGCFPRSMKYADGTYADAIWMMKKL